MYDVLTSACVRENRRQCFQEVCQFLFEHSANDQRHIMVFVGQVAIAIQFQASADCTSSSRKMRVVQMWHQERDHQQSVPTSTDVSQGKRMEDIRCQCRECRR